MILNKLNSQNVKLTLIETGNSEKPYVEIIINMELLQDFIYNLVLLGEKRQLFENPLTERELEVLNYIALGKSNEEIAKKLNVSTHTIKVHSHNIYNKLLVEDRTQAVIKAIKNYWISI